MGSQPSSLKDVFDLWARVRRRLNAKQKDILITWIKGHAADIDIQKGTPQLHTNTGAIRQICSRTLAPRWLLYRSSLFQGHQLKKHIVIVLQAMFLACYNRRQTRRQELLLETAVE